VGGLGQGHPDETGAFDSGVRVQYYDNDGKPRRWADLHRGERDTGEKEWTLVGKKKAVKMECAIGELELECAIGEERTMERKEGGMVRRFLLDTGC